MVFVTRKHVVCECVCVCVFVCVGVCVGWIGGNIILFCMITCDQSLFVEIGVSLSGRAILKISSHCIISPLLCFVTCDC